MFVNEKDGRVEERCLLEGEDETLVMPMLLSTNDVPIVWGGSAYGYGSLCQFLMWGGLQLIARRTDDVTVVLVDGSWLESEEKLSRDLYTQGIRRTWFWRDSVCG